MNFSENNIDGYHFKISQSWFVPSSKESSTQFYWDDTCIAWLYFLSSFSAEFDGVQDAVLELESSHWYVFCRRVKLVLLCVFVHLWGHGFVFLLRPEVSLNHVKRFLVDLAVLVALEKFYLVQTCRNKRTWCNINIKICKTDSTHFTCRVLLKGLKFTNTVLS